MVETKKKIIEIIDFYESGNLISFELSLNNFLSISSLLELSFNEEEFPELGVRIKKFKKGKIQESKVGLAYIMFLEIIEYYFFNQFKDKYLDYYEDYFNALYNQNLLNIKKQSILEKNELIVKLCVLEFISIGNCGTFEPKLIFDREKNTKPDYYKWPSIFLLKEQNPTNVFFQIACVLHLLTERDNWELSLRKIDISILEPPKYVKNSKDSLILLENMNFELYPKLYFLKAICFYNEAENFNKNYFLKEHLENLKLCEISVKKFIMTTKSSLGYLLLSNLYQKKDEFQISLEYAKIGYSRLHNKDFLKYIFECKMRIEEYYTAFLVKQFMIEERINFSSDFAKSPSSFLIDIFFEIIENFIVQSDIANTLKNLKVLIGITNNISNSKLNDLIKKILILKFPNFQHIFNSKENDLEFPFEIIFGEKIDLSFPEVKFHFQYMPFGKYKNKNISEILEIDSRYLLWAVINIKNFIVEPKFIFSSSIISDFRFFKLLVIYYFKHKSLTSGSKKEEFIYYTEDYTYSYEDWLNEEFGDDAGIAFWNMD